MNKEHTRNPLFIESICNAIAHFDAQMASEKQKQGGKGEERGATREQIYKYCEVTRTFDNRVKMLNQVRLALRQGVETGILHFDVTNQRYTMRSDQ